MQLSINAQSTTGSVSALSAADYGQQLFKKKILSNCMEVFDFNEEVIINKMEKIILLLDKAI